MAPIPDIWFELGESGEVVALQGLPDCSSAKMKVCEIDKNNGTIIFVTPDERYKRIFPASVLAFASFEQDGVKVILVG